MESLTSPSPISTIDFSKPDLVPGTLEWESMKTHVRKAMEDYGYFCASFAGEEHDHGFGIELFRLMKLLFDLPRDRKMDCAYGSNPAYSYIHRPQFPMFENLTVYDAWKVEKLESFVNDLLPRVDPGSSKPLDSFIKEATRVFEISMRMIAESLDIEKYLEGYMSSHQNKLRLTKYEASKTTSEAEIGLFTHVDTTSITILYQNHVSGLELQGRDGNWVAVTPPPNSFIILLGQCFDAWTNGRFHIPLHRAMINPGSEVRYSIGLFPRPKDGYTVETPEELVDEEHPLIYGPFDYLQFKKARNRIKHLRILEIKAYCGLQPSSAE